MTDAERLRAERLNDHLDALAAGWPHPDVDPAAADTVRRFFAGDDAPPLPHDLMDRIWEDIMYQSDLTTGSSAGTVALDPRSGTPSIPNGHVPPSARRRPVETRRRSWTGGLARLAAAALLLVALLYVVVGQGYRDHGRHAAVPAAVIPTATPRPAVPAEGMLLTVTVAGEDVPATTGLAAGLTVVTVPPGDQSAWVGDCCPGLRVNYVLEGTLAVRPAGPMGVVRGGGDGIPEPVPVGTEVILEAGDAMIADNDVPFDSANPGSTQVRFLMVDLTTQGNPVPVGWSLPAFSGAIGFAMPPGPVVLRLERVPMDPGADAPSRPDAVALMAVALHADPAGTPVASALASQGGSPVLDPPFLGGDRAADVYVLTVAPAEGGAGTAVAGSPTP